MKPTIVLNGVKFAPSNLVAQIASAPAGPTDETETAGETVYCYVTGEQCPVLKTADIGDEINGQPVAECGDYDAWKLDENETNALVFSASGYARRAALAVQKEMGWQVNLCPIRERLTQELRRIIERDNAAFSPDDVMAWMDAGVDEHDVATRNSYDPVDIGEDLAHCYADEREAIEDAKGADYDDGGVSAILDA